MASQNKYFSFGAVCGCKEGKSWFDGMVFSLLLDHGKIRIFLLEKFLEQISGEGMLEEFERKRVCWMDIG